MVCVFKHLYCSAQLSMSSMEKRYRNKIIIIIIIKPTQPVVWCGTGHEELSRTASPMQYQLSYSGPSLVCVCMRFF